MHILEICTCTWRVNQVIITEHCLHDFVYLKIWIITNLYSHYTCPLSCLLEFVVGFFRAPLLHKFTGNYEINTILTNDLMRSTFSRGQNIVLLLNERFNLKIYRSHELLLKKTYLHVVRAYLRSHLSNSTNEKDHQFFQRRSWLQAI